MRRVRQPGSRRKPRPKTVGWSTTAGAPTDGGPKSAVAPRSTFDVFTRRADLRRAARLEYDSLDTESQAVLDAFAHGINAFLELDRDLPTDLTLAGVTPEPWAPWDSCAVFLVRHVVFASWQKKLWRGRLAQLLGAETVARLEGRGDADVPLIVPPGALGEPISIDPTELDTVLTAMAEASDPAAGSNSWALAGDRTRSGAPLVAGDPHRLVEVPGVYYQCHLACPDFDAVGLAFVGVPGFPHFGHTAGVAWCVTNAYGDYQDLYVERLDGSPPSRTEVITVRDAEPVMIDCYETTHGPVLFGDPDTGIGNRSAPRPLRSRARPRGRAPHAPGRHCRRTRRGDAGLGRPGQQLRLRRRRRPPPLPNRRRHPRTRRRERLGSRTGLDHSPRVDRRRPLTSSAGCDRPGLHRHRQPADRRTGLPALPRIRVQPSSPGPPRLRPLADLDDATVDEHMAAIHRDRRSLGADAWVERLARLKDATTERQSLERLRVGTASWTPPPTAAAIYVVTAPHVGRAVGRSLASRRSGDPPPASLSGRSSRSS